MCGTGTFSCWALLCFSILFLGFFFVLVLFMSARFYLMWKAGIRFQSDEIDMAFQTWMLLVWSMDLVMVLLYMQVHDSRIFNSGSVLNFTTWAVEHDDLNHYSLIKLQLFLICPPLSKSVLSNISRLYMKIITRVIHKTNYFLKFWSCFVLSLFFTPLGYEDLRKTTARMYIVIVALSMQILNNNSLTPHAV